MYSVQLAQPVRITSQAPAVIFPWSPVSHSCKLRRGTGASPIVPVMMQGEGWSASGWLGLLTAGCLWTPLYDEATLAENFDGLVRQIKVVVGTDETGGAPVDQQEPDFSSLELRDELDRLRIELRAKTDGEKTVQQAAEVPAAVPRLPGGMLVTQSMTELLKHVTSSEITRIGFFGMGGIGKTVIASWLVRHESVLKNFDQIVWVTLGQCPKDANVQSLAFQQLTGGRFTGSEDNEQRMQDLQAAMQKKKILLVLDDVWETKHEDLLNFIDKACGSKVLISSRVREVLKGSGSISAAAQDTAVIVDIELPSADAAVQMLLSVAGLSMEGKPPPPQAHELVQFCKMLPLSISIAGKLVNDVGIEEVGDWDGIVELMKEEFAGQRTVEDSVIAASMKSIHGSQKKSITHLFKSLALLPVSQPVYFYSSCTAMTVRHLTWTCPLQWYHIYVGRRGGAARGCVDNVHSSAR